MNILWRRFNIYLTLGLAAASVCGCKTAAESKLSKQVSTLRLNIEVDHYTTKTSETVPICRDRPMMVSVDPVPFITEADVAEAKVIEVVGGFALRLRFDDAGRAMLEQYSVANLGRHIAIFSQFGDKIQEARWLAAPLITRHISDGVLTFTPDATREECEEIALGLNNVAKKVQVFPDFQ